MKGKPAVLGSPSLIVSVDLLLASEHSHLPKHHESLIKAEHLGQCWRLGTQSRNFTFAPQHFSSTDVSKNEPMSFNCTGKKKKEKKREKREQVSITTLLFLSGDGSGILGLHHSYFAAPLLC